MIRIAGIKAIVRLDNAPRELGDWDDDFMVLDIPFPDRQPIPNEIIQFLSKMTGFHLKIWMLVFCHQIRPGICSI